MDVTKPEEQKCDVTTNSEGQAVCSVHCVLLIERTVSGDPNPLGSATFEPSCARSQTSGSLRLTYRQLPAVMAASLFRLGCL